MKLSELLIKYRNDHDLSQRQFSAICGLSNGYISMIEKEINPKTGEKIKPTIQALHKMAAGMRMSLDDLFEIVDDMDIDISAKDGTLRPDEMEMLDAYRRLDQEGKDAVLNLIKALVPISKRGVK